MGTSTGWRRTVLAGLAAACAACAGGEEGMDPDAVEVPTGEAGPAPVVSDTAPPAAPYAP